MSSALLPAQSGYVRKSHLQHYPASRGHQRRMKKGDARRKARHGIIVAVYPALTCSYQNALSVANNHGLRVAVDREELVLWRSA